MNTEIKCSNYLRMFIAPQEKTPQIQYELTESRNYC